MEPRLRRVEKIEVPYQLNDFSKSVILSLAKDLLYCRLVNGNDKFEGSEFERSFARAIGALWKPSNIGLDDITQGNVCWGAKTVKNKSAHTASQIRLISGRNSVHYSFQIANVKDHEPHIIGSYVLDIWNARVDQVRERFKQLRTVVLIKGPNFNENVIFETETIRFLTDQYSWKWNKRGNLEGFNLAGKHKFTWQPHGSQFTIVETLPEKIFKFSIKEPPPWNEKIIEDVLKSVDFKDNWVTIL